MWVPIGHNQKVTSSLYESIYSVGIIFKILDQKTNKLGKTSLSEEAPPQLFQTKTDEKDKKDEKGTKEEKKGWKKTKKTKKYDKIFWILNAASPCKGQIKTKKTKMD